MIRRGELYRQVRPRLPAERLVRVLANSTVGICYISCDGEGTVVKGASRCHLPVGEFEDRFAKKKGPASPGASPSVEVLSHLT